MLHSRIFGGWQSTWLDALFLLDCFAEHTDRCKKCRGGGHCDLRVASVANDRSRDETRDSGFLVSQGSFEGDGDGRKKGWDLSI